MVGDSSDGDSDYFEQIQTFVDAEGLSAHVRFIGYVEQVHEVYAAVDVVAHASIEAEPSGRVIAEAMGYERPIVASCFGGPKEFIHDGVNGFLVDPRSTEEFAAKLVELLTDPALRRRMGAAGLQTALARFDNRTYAASIAEVYRKCVSN